MKEKGNAYGFTVKAVAEKVAALENRLRAKTPT